jgi:hypothetical protein
MHVIGNVEDGLCLAAGMVWVRGVMFLSDGLARSG